MYAMAFAQVLYISHRAKDISVSLNKSTSIIFWRRSRLGLIETEFRSNQFHYTVQPYFEAMNPFEDQISLMNEMCVMTFMEPFENARGDTGYEAKK